MAENGNTGASDQQADRLSSSDLGQDSTSTTNLEWAQIAFDKVVVASPERTWLYQPRSSTDPFAQAMEGAGSNTTTGKLLDGAIAVAKQVISSDARPPALTSTRWIWRLASAYHMTSPVPDLMKEAARGFAANGHSELEAWALEKAEEEKGHDLLALRDIQSLGYDAEVVVKTLVPPAAIALMDYFTRGVKDHNPIDCVGYTYTMERISLNVGEDYIQKVEKLMPTSVNATRCLRVHSSVGVDAGHADENVSLVAKLAPAERSRIARACYETALIFFSPPSAEYITDRELQEILQPLKM